MKTILTNRAIFIPTYNRSNNVITYNALKEANCRERIYLIVGEDDPDLENYKKRYKDEVIVFSKKEVRPRVDLCDNFEKEKCVVYARNKMFEIAKDLGLDYFCVLDDDYDRFNFRRVFEDVLKGFNVKDVQKVIDLTYEYLDGCDVLDCIAWAQGGDFIGGADTFPNINGKRKIMNAFFFRTARPIRFIGSINEDLNASVYEGQRGKVFFTINDVSINQKDTQQNKGGLTDVYLDLGTYVKSFYSVIVAPNCVKISAMGNKDLRIHHKVIWNKCCPKIISERWKQ